MTGVTLDWSGRIYSAVLLTRMISSAILTRKHSGERVAAMRVQLVRWPPFGAVLRPCARLERIDAPF